MKIKYRVLRVHIYIYYVYILYVCSHENNMPSRLSCAQEHELPQTHCGDNLSIYLPIFLPIYLSVCIPV